jgi:sugar phosphate permease
MTAVGAFVTAFYIGYVVSNAVSGFTTDIIGARITLGIGLVLFGVLTGAFAFTSSFASGAAIQMLMGLASGVDYAAGVKLNTTWFARAQRGTAFGFYMTATSLAVIVTNATVPALSARSSWRGAYELLGAGTIVVGIVSLALIRNGNNPSNPNNASTARAASVTVVRRSPEFSLLLAKPSLGLAALAGFGAMWGTWGFTFWANALMVRGRGLHTAEAAGIMVLFGIGAVIGKPIVGMVSDWLGGRRKVLTIACLAGFAPALLVFGWSDTASAFRSLAPVLGVFAFIYSPLMGTMIAEIAGAELAASATGVTNAFWQLGSVTVPVVVGAVFQATSSFHAAFATLAAGPALAAIVMLFVQAD